MPGSEQDRIRRRAAESKPVPGRVHDRPLEGDLGRIRFFDGWTSDELDHFARVARRVSFAAGERLIVEGEQGVGFLVLIAGEVEVTSGKRLLARLGPGDHAGELSLLDGSPTSANVVALSPVEALNRERAGLSRLAQDGPEP